MVLLNNLHERSRQRWLYDRADPNIVMASGIMFDPNALTLGFARRFATYKRATLMLQDIERLKRILTDKNHPVQIIFAGKAHPNDNAGKLLIQNIFNIAKDPSFGGRMAFIEDYDEELAQYLVHGVDVWLNNPLPPFEASGTSGMKAEVNGTPHLSVLDGWWIEGFNGKNGWAYDGESGEGSDKIDSEEFYNILEKNVIPLYYSGSIGGVPSGWVKVMKEAMKSTGPHFSARRMVKEYSLKFYKKALKSAAEPTLKPL
jgi:glycogen phosphorylase